MFPIIPVPAYYDARVMTSRGQQQQHQPSSGVSRRKGFLLSDILINVQSAKKVAKAAASASAIADDSESSTIDIATVQHAENNKEQLLGLHQEQLHKAQTTSNSCMNDEQTSLDSVDIDVTDTDTVHSDGEARGADKVTAVSCSSVNVGQGQSRLSFGIDRLLRPDNPRGKV